MLWIGSAYDSEVVGACLRLLDERRCDLDFAQHGQARKVQGSTILSRRI